VRKILYVIPLGLIREDVDMRALLFKLMHETIAVGRAAGIDLPEALAAELDRSRPFRQP
jgi:hypothetical protein